MKPKQKHFAKYEKGSSIYFGRFAEDESREGREGKEGKILAEGREMKGGREVPERKEEREVGKEETEEDDSAANEAKIRDDR